MARPRTSPRPISTRDAAARQARVSEIARGFGFVGRVEYRHVYSTTGGAQFGLGTGIGRDLLIVYAEAFERDSKPDDFSLEAIIAHERGHQIQARNQRLRRLLPGAWSEASEEIVASILASLLVKNERDAEI